MTHTTDSSQIAVILERLGRIEASLQRLISRDLRKEFYSVEDFAAAVGLAPYTVREHCRTLRIRASKTQSGRGKHRGWVISRDELLRYQREGLLPVDSTREQSPAE